MPTERHISSQSAGTRLGEARFVRATSAGWNWGVLPSPRKPARAGSLLNRGKRKQSRKMSPGELIMAPEQREATLFALLKRDTAIWRGRQRRNADFAPDITRPRQPQSEARAKRITSWTPEGRQAVRERTGGIPGRPPDPGKYFEADAPCGRCGCRLRYIRNKSCVECARVWNARAAGKRRRPDMSAFHSERATDVRLCPKVSATPRC